MKNADELLEKISELMVMHVADAGDAAKPRATIEAIACAQAAGEAFHAFVCGGEGHCPRQAANVLTETMLHEVQGAVARAFAADHTGYVQ